MSTEHATSAASFVFNVPLRAIALRDLEDASITSSASGGAFAVLARAMLERGGAVFGAAMLEDNRVEHVCARSRKELTALQGSKYVRSDVADTYAECAELLSAGADVLYSGTPCQIAGLRSFLKGRGGSFPGSLISVDLICHGTPRQELFIAYLDWLAEKKSADDKIYGYKFRSKLMGWGLYYYYYYYRSGRRYEELGQAGDDPYYSAFVKGTIYRKCCYSCPFARIERVGDFTIGDFWGLEECHPGFYDERGVSAVFINTPEADAFFCENCSDLCEWIESTVENVVAQNRNLTGPTKRSKKQTVLAEEVDKAVAEGNYERAFGELLKPQLSVTAKIRRALPWRLVRLLYKIKRH